MRKVLFLFCAALLSVSCNIADKFTIIEMGEPLFYGMTSVHGKAVVENSLRRDFIIENGELRFRYKNRELASAQLMLPVKIPARSVSPIRYDLRLESESLSNLQTLHNRMQTNPLQIFVDVTAYIRYGNIRRKVEIRDVPYIGIIVNFERSENK